MKKKFEIIHVCKKLCKKAHMEKFICIYCGIYILLWYNTMWGVRVVQPQAVSSKSRHNIFQSILNIFINIFIARLTLLCKRKSVKLTEPRYYSNFRNIGKENVKRPAKRIHCKFTDQIAYSHKQRWIIDACRQASAATPYPIKIS